MRGLSMALAVLACSVCLTAAASASQTRVAVSYFDNTSGKAELETLKKGLVEGDNIVTVTATLGEVTWTSSSYRNRRAPEVPATAACALPRSNRTTLSAVMQLSCA